jgi:hypothetical protein
MNDPRIWRRSDFAALGAGYLICCVLLFGLYAGCLRALQQIQSYSFQIDPGMGRQMVLTPLYAVLVAWHVLMKGFFPFLTDDDALTRIVEQLNRR